MKINEYIQIKNEVSKKMSLSNDKPQIDCNTLEKWQRIIDMVAEILDAPTALITQISKDKERTFLTSNNAEDRNKKRTENLLGKGLYSKTAKDRISYCGDPIKWPDEEVFGTICIIDSNPKNYNDRYVKFISEISEMIETDLLVAIQRKELEKLANYDTLTGVYNRRVFNEMFEKKLALYQRDKKKFSLVIFDLDNFKEVNDMYGHCVGDKVLQIFAKSLMKNIRCSDLFARFGGDEFVLVCEKMNKEQTIALLKRIKPKILKDVHIIVSDIDFSYGVAESCEMDSEVMDIFKRGDIDLYSNKYKR